MRFLIDLFRSLRRPAPRKPALDERSYHTQRMAQELASFRRAKSPAARRAHRTLAARHLRALDGDLPAAFDPHDRP